MAGFLYFLFAVMVALAGLAFHVRNAEPVVLDFFVGSAELELSLVLVATLVLGVVLGMLAMSASQLKLRRELRRLARRHEMTGRELANLRALTGTDAG